jgi:hypothetical protein
MQPKRHFPFVSTCQLNFLYIHTEEIGNAPTLSDKEMSGKKLNRTLFLSAVQTTLELPVPLLQIFTTP